MSQAGPSSGSDWRRSRGVMDSDADGVIIVVLSSLNVILVINVTPIYSLYGQIVMMRYINY